MAIHYGHGKWVTVDSCLDEHGKPASLTYLTGLGVDVATAVTHTILTHSDGDHVGGLFELYSASASSQLVCSLLLTERDVLSFITSAKNSDSKELSLEAQEVYGCLITSAKRSPLKGPMYVFQDTPILQAGNVRLTAVAPSQSKVGAFIKKIALLTEAIRADLVKSLISKPNAVSVAMVLQRDLFSAILGADLEESPGKGWSDAIDQSLALKNAPSPSLYKVAHHGSENADLDKLWSTMTAPVAILAPFRHGRHKLPTESRVAEILTKTDKGICHVSAYSEF